MSEIVKIKLPKRCNIIFSSDGSKFFLKCPYSEAMLREDYSWASLKKKWHGEEKYWELKAEDFEEVIEIINDHFS